MQVTKITLEWKCQLLKCTYKIIKLVQYNGCLNDNKSKNFSTDQSIRSSSIWVSYCGIDILSSDSGWQSTEQSCLAKLKESIWSMSKQSIMISMTLLLLRSVNHKSNWYTHLSMRTINWSPHPHIHTIFDWPWFRK